MASIKAPVFFIVGDRDVTTAAHAAEMNRLVPGSWLMIVPCGHGTYMIADETGSTNSDFIDFLINQVKKFLNSNLSI
ncbi:MAG TPA: alpha/beta hydrolase [Niabella sp.]|nr:alpha/beta hydrolase [Niabella sp.]